MGGLSEERKKYKVVKTALRQEFRKKLDTRKDIKKEVSMKGKNEREIMSFEQQARKDS